MSAISLELRSVITSEGRLRLSLEEVQVASPGLGEVMIRVEATPVNPSDMGSMLSPADMGTLAVEDGVTTASVPPQLIPFLGDRVGRPDTPGLEGAGTVVEAGPDVQHLLGKVVGTGAGRMWTQYRTLPVSEVIEFPAGVSAVQSASSYVNPLTAIGFLNTMRDEGHSAIVHTAAASNLGQMLVKLAIDEGIGLVNIVRSEEQVALLRSLGAEHIVNSGEAGFAEHLVAAIRATGATIGFDAVGGGTLAGEILIAMEAAISRPGEGGAYGSSRHKQVYIYGRLDRTETVVPSRMGMAWGIGGWLLANHLAKVGLERTNEMRAKVAAEIATTFASQYTREVSLAEAITPESINSFRGAKTGAKFLIRPHL